MLELCDVVADLLPLDRELKDQAGQRPAAQGDVADLLPLDRELKDKPASVSKQIDPVADLLPLDRELKEPHQVPALASSRRCRPTPAR